MTNKELLDKIRKEILHLKMKELQRTNGVNTGADVHLSSYAVLSILSNALTEESEDERIRKEMIAYFAHRADVTEFIDEGEDCKSWISYLEKQKEQKHIDYPYLPGWRKNRDNNKPELKRSVLMLTTHGVAEGEWLGEKWCQYRWSCELKDGEVLYWIHLSDLERLEKEGEEKHKEQEHICDSAQYEEGFKTGLEIGLRKQRPAWSEEDEERVKEAIKRIDELEFMGIPCNNIRKVLQSLRPSWKPSEEQMKALENSTALTEEQGAALYSLIQDLKKL